MKRYSVAVAGLGMRGRAHLAGILAHPDLFEVVGLFNPGEENRQRTRREFGLDCFFDSPERMMAQTRPDVLCFATHPQIRREYVDLAVKYRVRALSMEKPFALNMKDARELVQACDAAGIKTVVSVQHKYYSQHLRQKRLVDSGEIGRVNRIVAETTPWMHILGTHLMEYILWISGETGADWVAGHVSGPQKLRDNHVSPDFLMGLIHFPDGLYAQLECGYLSQPHYGNDVFWTDNRLSVFGDDGYVWADTQGRIGICSPNTGGRLRVEQEPEIALQDAAAERAFYRDLHAWLEDDQAVHPCSLARSYAAYEALTALCLSGLDNRRVDLPLGEAGDDVIERMKRELPEQAIPESIRAKGFFDHWGS